MKFNIIISILALYFLSTSCEKVIDVDLNESSPKPVFEAYMEADSTCYVKASWTSSYYDNSSSPVIAGATITVSDQLNNTESLVYIGDGIYKGVTMLGIIGNTYTLSVSLNGTTYVANSTMPPLIVIDSFSMIPRGSFGGPPSSTPKFWVFVNYTDSANFENYYAVKTTYYDSIDYATDYRIANDDLSDGISTRAFTTFTGFEQGDTVTVELASIDRVTHLYFKTIQDAISGSGFASAAPANPTNNFTNGALGYFGAWSKDTKQYIVP